MPDILVTLILPTYNRPHFLGRLLPYYRDVALPYPIVVADSSEGECLRRSKDAVDLLGASLRIDHKTYQPSIHIMNKLWESLKDVSTPYVALAADDDFCIPSTIGRAAQFLAKHPEYAVAHGDAITFILKSTKSNPVYGEVAQTDFYNQRTNDLPTGARRLLDHLTYYSPTFYSVHRTEQLRENLWKTIHSKVDDYHFIELLLSGLSLIQGKAKRLVGLYMVRQTNSAKEYTVTDLFDWIASPSPSSQYERFRDCLARELAHQDNISLSEAQEAVKQAFWAYLVSALRNQWEALYAQRSSGLRSSSRKLARQMPTLRLAWHTFRSFLPGEDNKMSLQALLRPTSPYHADFMPVYRAVTSGKGAN